MISQPLPAMVTCGSWRRVNTEIASVCRTDELTRSRWDLSDVDSCWTWRSFTVLMKQRSNYTGAMSGNFHYLCALSKVHPPGRLCPAALNHLADPESHKPPTHNNENFRILLPVVVHVIGRRFAQRGPQCDSQTSWLIADSVRAGWFNISLFNNSFISAIRYSTSSRTSTCGSSITKLSTDQHKCHEPWLLFSQTFIITANQLWGKRK